MKKRQLKKRQFRKNKVSILILAMILLLLCVGMMIVNSFKKEKKLAYSEEYVLLAELPSQLSFTYYAETQWTEKIKEMIHKKDLKEALTYENLELLLEQLSVKNYVTYEKKSEHKLVSRSQWNEIYKQILDLLDTQNVVVLKNLIFLTPNGEQNAKKDELPRLTQEGYYEIAKGVDYFHYYDTYQVYVKGNRVIGVCGIGTEQVTLSNVFIHTAKEEKAEILYEGERISFDMKGLTEEITDTICDIEWQNNKVLAVYKKEEMIQGKVLSFNENQIEISGYGTLEHAGKLKVYKTYGTVEQLDESKLMIGNLQADFVVADKQVCGIILKQPATNESIRVLLLNETKIFHENPIFVADVQGTITIGEQVIDITPGQSINPGAMIPEGSTEYAKIALKDGNGRIYFSDGNGQKSSLGYRGTLEIRRYPNGYGVVNEVSLEQYLYGVVPSEMPSSYEIEALRAQAVCARSYACIQLMKGNYAEFGAHVDDSTNYQVYNKQAEDVHTNLAVDDTIGEVIKYQGEIAEAYYFSTSCGYTDNIGIWNLPQDITNSYLQGTGLLVDGSQQDLSKEDIFRSFIQNTDIVAFDSEATYFRWKIELSVKEHLAELNGAIGERNKLNSENTQIIKADGSKAEAGELSSFGGITNMTVEERSAGGCIRKLQISYEQGNVVLLNEYDIRCILGKAMTRLTDKNGKETKMSILPSAYAAVIPVEEGYVLYGGGYGHGLGMSQNGANGMAKTGMTYTDILMKYYSGITIENIYNGE
ncbi:MAG: SpoIID/LytB domain-containing protein [Lachnospiraceae bacterium]